MVMWGGDRSQFAPMQPAVDGEPSAPATAGAWGCKAGGCGFEAAAGAGEVRGVKPGTSEFALDAGEVERKVRGVEGEGVEGILVGEATVEGGADGRGGAAPA